MEDARKLDRGRRVARRQFAYVSFYFLLFFATSVTATLLWSGERKLVADALAGAFGTVAGIISTFTVIVGAYLGVSLVEAIKRGPPQ